MKIKLFLATAIVSIALFIFSACKKDQTVILTSTVPVSETSYESLKPENQLFKIDATQGGTIIGDRGMTFTFNPNSFRDYSGKQVNGIIEIHLTEVVTYAEMIGTGARTEAIDGILGSAGMFNINASQNGNVLYLSNPVATFIPVNMDVDLDDVIIFSGKAIKNKSNKDSAVIWIVDSSVIYKHYNDSIAKVYDSINKIEEQKKIVKFQLNTLGWCNLDAYRNSSTGFLVRVKHTGIANVESTEVYMKLNQNNLKGLYLLSYNPTQDEFNSTYYYLPAGWNIHLIVLVRDKNQKIYKEDRIITHGDAISNFSNLKEISQVDLESFFKNLDK